MCYAQTNERVEFGFRWEFSLATFYQRELGNHNPLFKPKSGAIRYLIGPEIIHPGPVLVNFLSFCGGSHMIHNYLSLL